MNINQLEYFVATVRHGSFSTAAKELFITPQTVSKAVNDLERELHVQLLEKSARGVETTRFGALFAERSAETLSCLLDLKTIAKNYASSAHDQGSLSVAVTSSTCRGNVFTAADFKAFASDFPRIALTLHYRQSGSCLSALEERTVDAAIVFGRTAKPGLVCVKLLSHPPLVAMSCSHPLAQRRRVRLAELARFPIAMPEDLRSCYPTFSHHFNAHGLTARFCPLPPLPANHRRFLDEEQGIIFVTDDPQVASHYPTARFVSLAEEDDPRIPICLVYRSANANAALVSLERYLISTASRIKKGRR